MSHADKHLDPPKYFLAFLYFGTFEVHLQKMKKITNKKIQFKCEKFEISPTNIILYFPHLGQRAPHYATNLNFSDFLCTPPHPTLQGSLCVSMFRALGSISSGFRLFKFMIQGRFIQGI